MSYPKSGEVFELTLETPPDPMEMVLRDAPHSPWTFVGSEFKGPLTGKFMLIPLDYPGRMSTEEITNRLLRFGDIPQGHWRDAFKAIFPVPDRGGKILIADPSWRSSFDIPLIPVIRQNGVTMFEPIEVYYRGTERWLVLVRDENQQAIGEEVAA